MAGQPLVATRSASAGQSVTARRTSRISRAGPRRLSSNALGMVSATPSSLIFTGQDIRIAEPRLRLAIAYARFGAYTFWYEYIPGGRTGPDVFEPVIDGPTPWRSPNAVALAQRLSRRRAHRR